MQKSTLEAVGLRTNRDIPANEIFSATFEPKRYGLSRKDRRTVKCLHDFVTEYNRERPLDKRKAIKTSLQAAELLHPMLRGLDHEEIWFVTLNRAGFPIKKHLVGIGNAESTVIDVRRIVKTALDDGASYLIVYHNHPSGIPTPSSKDILYTEDTMKALKLFNIGILDHIIVSDTSYYSFSEAKTSLFKDSKHGKMRKTRVA